jgi:hypothetical protein
MMDRNMYGKEEADRRMHLAWLQREGLIGDPVPEQPRRPGIAGAIGRTVAGILSTIGLRQPAMRASASDA